MVSPSPDGELAELAVTASRVQQAVERVRGRAHAPDGAVRVEAGVDGRMSALDIHPDALHLGADRLARLIVEVHAAAQAEAVAAAEPLREQLLTDRRVARVLARLEGRGAPEPDPGPDPDPDRYYATFSVFGTDPDRQR
ncbi:YbaB/EbfC family nucleoid-associated protein [Rhodococcus sp. NPDC003348]